MYMMVTVLGLSAYPFVCLLQVSWFPFTFSLPVILGFQSIKLFSSGDRVLFTVSLYTTCGYTCNSQVECSR